MENRSLDHYLGWYGGENPNFDGLQHAQVPDLRVPGNPLISTDNWGAHGRNSAHGRGFSDPSHGWDGGRYERSGGTLQGWLDPRTGNDEFSLAYYDAVDVPVWSQLARSYQTYDRWHCSLLGPTQPNRYYMHSAQSGGLKNNNIPPQYYEAGGHDNWLLGWDWPTIWTLLDRGGVSSAYYYSNLPVLAYWGAKHVSSMRPVAEFFAQADTGTLPSVSFIDPFFTISDDFGNDDHPHADLRLGQAFLSDVVQAFTASKQYHESAMVVTYDEWGGFHDHVAPPRVADDRGTPNDPAGPDDFGQIGFRVPTSIVSPWTRGGGAVDHTTYEHASVVRFIQDNWNLPNLTLRSKSTNSIEHAFGGFAHRNDTVDFVPYDAPLNLWVESGQAALNDFADKTKANPTNPGVPFAARPSPTAPLTEGSSLQELRDIGWMDKFGIRTDYKLADSFMHSRPELLAATRLPVLP